MDEAKQQQRQRWVGGKAKVFFSSVLFWGSDEIEVEACFSAAVNYCDHHYDAG